jgi:hypothetical protein
MSRAGASNAQPDMVRNSFGVISLSRNPASRPIHAATTIV